MSTEAQTLQAEIMGDERAIRHLIGERAALNSQLKREEAVLKLHEQRLHALSTKNHPAVSKGGPPLPHGHRFPDVSSYQPHVDFRLVHDDKAIGCGDIAFTKLTEGLSWTDPYGNMRLRSMRAFGFPHRGAYHFAHPSENPTDQANHFLAVAFEEHNEITAADVLACDLEVSDGQPGGTVRFFAKEFAATLRKHTPAKLWLYGGGPFLHEYSVPLDGYDAHWLPAYGPTPVPYMIYGRSRTVAWQYTDGHYGPSPHVVEGIGGCDVSIIL